VHNEGGVHGAKRAHPAQGKKSLVGSSVIPPPASRHPNKAKPPVFTKGNQAAVSGGSQGFYNTARKGTKAPAAHAKSLVGSSIVTSHDRVLSTPGVGNQAAGQNHFDVGTNIVFHGVHNEGGVHGAKRAHPAAQGKKSLVGSNVIPPPVPNHVKPKPPIYTVGNQAAVSGGSHGFYNSARRTKIF